MATKKPRRKRTAARRRPKKRRAPKPARKRTVDLRTHERRERVLELWGKPSRLIAKFLLEEGFEVDAGEMPVTKPKQEEWERTRIERMRRNVDNDRAWWEAKWRARAKKPRTSEDLEVDLESNIAAINSDVDEISELLTEKGTKSSAKALLFQSKLRARELILRARGIDKAAERDPDAGDVPVRPAILLYDISCASPETKAKYGLDGDGK